MRSRKLAWFLMLGLLIALAGCGSDGNGGGMTAMPDPDPPPVDMEALEAAQAAAMTAYDEAKQAVADVEDNKSADMDSYDMAVAKRDEAKTANDMAQAAETVEDAEKYRDMAQAANTEAMSYADMVTTAAANKAASEAAMAMAAAIAPAIADPDGDGVIVGVDQATPPASQTALRKDDRPGGSATPAERVTFMVAAGGAVTVDLDGTGGTDQTDTLDKNDMIDDDNDSETPMVPLKNQFQKQDGEPAALEGFTGSVHERTVEKVTDTLTVYTNAEDNADQAYQMYYESGDVAARDGITSIADNSDIGTGDDAYMANVITFSDDVSDISDEIVATRFRVGNDITASGTFTDDEDTEDLKENEVIGSFNGIPGTYICTAGNCTIGTDENGRVDTFTGTWTFTPTEAGSKMMVQDVIPDADFLTFGYWLQATEQDDGSTKYGINSFYAGAQPFAAGLTVEGTAEYSGKATGMYARKTFNDKGVGTPTSSGQFTADANLMAYFGGNDVAVNLKNSITGTVSNFMDDSGNMIDDDWSVKLNRAAISSGADPAGSITLIIAAGDTVGTTARPATTTGGGSWQGAFYGNPMNADGAIVNDPDPLAAENAPTGVAGEFNAHFSNGHVIGAFGATKK